MAVWPEGISGHWEVRVLLVRGEVAALGLQRGPPSGVTDSTAGRSEGTRSQELGIITILRTGLRSPCLWAGLLHEPINPPSCSPRLLLGFSSLSAVVLAPRCLCGCCRQGPSFGLVCAGRPGMEPFSYNTALVPWTPLWGERSSFWAERVQAPALCFTDKGPGTPRRSRWRDKRSERGWEHGSFHETTRLPFCFNPVTLGCRCRRGRCAQSARPEVTPLISLPVLCQNTLWWAPEVGAQGQDLKT